MTSPPADPQVTVVAEPVPSVALPVVPSAPPASQAMMQPQTAQYGQRFPQQYANQVANQAAQMQPPSQPRQPHTHIEVKVAVPEGTVPGQQVFCTLPDGRRAMVVAEEHLAPGFSMTVRFPAQLPSQQPSQAQQANLQPPPLHAPLMSPLPETDVSPEDSQAATRYWWVYGLSWLACCVAPWIGACMMCGMTIHYFCMKTSQERARRPRQGMPAKVAAATLGAKCLCVALTMFGVGILYLACGENFHECPGFEMRMRRWHHGHHHRHGMAMMEDDWEGHHRWHGDRFHPDHHHGHGDHFHPGGHHQWHADPVRPGFGVPPQGGKPAPKCQACLASGLDYCVHEDRCTKRATYTCQGPHDHITGDEEFALHGNPHAKHSMICPGSEVKATSDVSVMAEAKNKEIVQEPKPCKMKKHLMAFAAAVKSFLETKQAAEKTATLVV